MNLKIIAVASFVAMAAAPLGAMAESTPKQVASDVGQYAADAALTTKVKAALLAEKNLNSLDVNVETLNGVVQLSGFATSSAQIAQAVDVTKRVKGVKDVRSDLRLKTDTEG